MSDMQRNAGIVKRLSTKENALEVFQKLVKDGIVEEKWCEVDENGVHYIDHDNYTVVNGAIFDISGAEREDDFEYDFNEAEKLNETDYRIHAYFYNGGASLGEMLDESIPKADEEYAMNSTPKEILRKALKEARVSELEALMLVTQIFEEANVEKNQVS